MCRYRWFLIPAIIFLFGFMFFVSYAKATEGDAEAYYNRGVDYYYLGKYTEALEACKEAIRIKPDYAEAHFSLGWVYAKLGKYSEAIEALKKAIRIEPNLAEAHYHLGEVYLKLGDKDSALKEYKILKNLDNDKANELLNLINQQDRKN